jgi:SAM-dependent methyltransferase
MLNLANLVARLEFLAQCLVRSQKRCPHCGSTEERLLARKHALVKVRQCERCALCHTDPIYQSWLPGFYDALYSENDLTTDVPEPSVLQQLKATQFAGTNKDFVKRLTKFKEAKFGPKMIELGSSWGYFLYQAQTLGFEPIGVEIASRRRRFGCEQLGVDIRESMEGLPDAHFDWLYTSHVLEHFQDLSKVFSQIARVLKPGGKLLIEVPNFAFAQAPDYALSIVGAVHPIGFTREFFAKNLPGYGFEDIAFLDSWDSFRASDEFSTTHYLLAQRR